MNTHTLRESILDYIESMRCPDAPYGRWRYARSHKESILYASIYAAMARRLYNDLDCLNADQRSEWVQYIQSFQDDDGFFKDRRIAHEGSWYVHPHDNWCGWWHLSTHVIIALTALGAVAEKPFKAVRQYLDEKELFRWLEARELNSHAAFAVSEVMNVLILLLYERDFHNDDRSGRAVEMMFDWLDANQQASTGTWGPAELLTPEQKDNAYQGAYHLYFLYDYDNRPVLHREAIIDFFLTMQTEQGGFGIHEDTTGCEDIDGMDPLVRMAMHTDYRKENVERAIRRSVDWVLRNRSPDGSFYFRRNREFFYGSDFMYSNADEGSIFCAWWRSLSIAIASRLLQDDPLVAYNWGFVKCPGYQFFGTVKSFMKSYEKGIGLR